jgi:hypothetical protein
MVSHNEECWVLPTLSRKLVDDLVELGHETRESISSKRFYTKTREAWIASVFLLRKILIEGRLWYLRKNVIEDSVDDIYARPFENVNGVWYSEYELPIQVFRRTDQSKGNIYDSIIDKLHNHDLHNVSLVLYVMKDEVVDWNGLFDKMDKLKPRVRDVSIIGNIGERKFVVGEIFPYKSISAVNLDLYELVGPKIVQAIQVNKAEDSGVSKIGQALLTTSFDIIDLERNTKI